MALLFNTKNINQKKILRPRKDPRKYYKTLYGHIAIIDEITKCYVKSLKDVAEGKIAAISYENYLIEVQTSDKFLENFKKAYVNFTRYYVKTSSQGYEIFLSKKLRDQLGEFWQSAIWFNDNPPLLQDAREVEKFNKLNEETTDYMEKLFGLKDDLGWIISRKLTNLWKRTRGDKND